MISESVHQAVMNVTLCEVVDICLNTWMERIIVATSTLVLAVNIVHMIFLSHLNKSNGTVFYKLLRFVTCGDMMSSLLCALTSMCLWRQAVGFAYPIVLYVISFFAFFTVNIMYTMYLFSIFDRWLMLARPFQYENHFFIRNFTKLVFAAAINGLVSTPLTFIIQYYLTENFPCYDARYGLLFCHPSSIHVCLTPVLLANLLIIVLAVLYFIEYAKMRRRQELIDKDMRQAANYVCVSSSAYLLSAFTWIVTACLILSHDNQFVPAIPLFKTISMLVYQLNGIWNVLALYAVMDSYRKKVKLIVYSCLTRRRNNVRVLSAKPRELANST